MTEWIQALIVVLVLLMTGGVVIVGFFLKQLANIAFQLETLNETMRNRNAP